MHVVDVILTESEEVIVSSVHPAQKLARAVTMLMVSPAVSTVAPLTSFIADQDRGY